MDRAALLTSYLSKKPHPNSPQDSFVVGRRQDGFVENNSIDYISPWYNSVTSLGLSGFVFYDNLSDDFVSRFSSELITFIKCESSEYSNNDWRFFCFLNFVESLTGFDYVFCSDASDVIVKHDPSGIVRDFPEFDLFIGKDSIKLSEFPYLELHDKLGWADSVYFHSSQNYLDLINVGVMGGKIKEVVNYLKEFVKVRKEMGFPEFNADMWVGQYVCRHVLQHKNVLIGSPLTSDFKSYEKDRDDVYFIHK
jgi:hypothetical protein